MIGFVRSYREHLQIVASLVFLISVSHTPYAKADPLDMTMISAFQKPPEEGGVRRWQVSAEHGLQLYDGPSASARTISDASQGAILTNLGCIAEEAKVWCEVQPLRGRSHGFVHADGLAPSRGPDGVVATGENDSRQRARKRDYDATGTVGCAQERGQTLGTCTVGVSRSTGGDATVVATFTNGFTRQLYFLHGEFVAANATMSGVGNDTDWSLEGGVHIIRVDDQRFELPDALLFGK
ncbi:hypothetical protein [Roseobacter sp.]|uniref:hypothetical protein n=1 Tax=Roseobacter sp. TaxID=1907202 RepID=UPI0038595737